MKRVAAKFVPKHLRVEVSEDMVYCINSDPDFMTTIISGDESWVYGYYPKTKSDERTKHYPLK